VIVLNHSVTNSRRDRRGQNQVTNGVASPLQPRDVIALTTLEELVDRALELVGAEELAKRVGGYREPVGNGNAHGRQFPAHLTERGVLSANDWNVRNGEIREPAHPNVGVLAVAAIHGRRQCSGLGRCSHR